MSDESLVFRKWEELKSIVEALELDVTKNATKGVAAAGVRARKGLRHLQSVTKELVKATLVSDKAKKAAKE